MRQADHAKGRQAWRKRGQSPHASDQRDTRPVLGPGRERPEQWQQRHHDLRGEVSAMALGLLMWQRRGLSWETGAVRWWCRYAVHSAQTRRRKSHKALGHRCCKSPPSHLASSGGVRALQGSSQGPTEIFVDSVWGLACPGQRIPTSGLELATARHDRRHLQV
jgi:hypothetical protein